MPLQIRRGTTPQRTAIVPLPGELIYDTTTGGIYVGNGTTSGGLAAINLSPGDIRNVSAAMFTSGVHTGISFDYEPAYNRINATISPDLSNYQGVIRASAFNGSLVADDSTTLVDALISKIELDGTVKGNIVPDSDSAYDIGSSGLKFKDLYLSGSSIYLGSATITSTGSVVNLPAGSKVGGVVIGTGTGTGDGVIEGSNYKINIVGANSSVIVDADNNTLKGSLKALDGTTAYNAGTKNFTGSFLGNVTGNILSTTNSSTVVNTSAATAVFTGNLTGNVTGNVTGSLTTNTITTTSASISILPKVVFGDTVEIPSIDNGPGLLTIGAPAKSVGVNIYSQTFDNLLNTFALPGNDFNMHVAKTSIADPDPLGTYDPIEDGPLGIGMGGMRWKSWSGNLYQVNAGIFCQHLSPSSDPEQVDFNHRSAMIFLVGTGTAGERAYTTLEPNGAFTAPILKSAPNLGSSFAYPSPAEEGMIVFDTGTKHFMGYNGTTWKQLDN